MDLDIAKVAISVVIAVTGWIVGHHFNSQRDAAANRKKMVTEYLVSSYRNLNTLACACAAGTKGSQALANNINSAVSDVQLFGTPKQIALTKKIVEHFSGVNPTSGNPLTELLLDLRDALRTELRLDAVNEPILFCHIKFSANDPTQQE